MPNLNTDVIPLVVGLSLCGASAALLYIWFQTKEIADKCDPPLARLRRQISAATSAAAGGGSTSSGTAAASAPAQRRIECVIPNHLVPLVEGRSGANLRAIEAQTACRVTFRPRDSDSQICEISGPNPLAVQQAADLVRKEAAPAPIVTDLLRVPHTSCGLVIGRGGEALQDICRRSLAKVYVEPGERLGAADVTDAGGIANGNGAAEPMRTIRITGQRAHVQMARAMLEERIRETERQTAAAAQEGVKREPRVKHSNPDAATVTGNGEAATATATANIVLPPATQQCVSVPPVDGNQLEVYVSAIASPSRFWLQLVGPQSQRLDTMVTEMTDYYGRDANRLGHKIADPYLGQIVAALFKYDGKWYRAEIVGILPNEFNPRNVVLDLYFVDFGDSEYVAPNEVYELRTDFLTLRFQAIECFLAGVKSTNPAEPEVWSPNSISRFEELTHVAQWSKMHARIVTTKERKYGDLVRRESSPVPGVELFDSNDLNITSILLQENCALEDLPAAAGSLATDLQQQQQQQQPTQSFATIAANKTRLLHEYDDFSATCSESIIEAEKRQMLSQTSSEQIANML